MSPRILLWGRCPRETTALIQRKTCKIMSTLFITNRSDPAVHQTAYPHMKYCSARERNETLILVITQWTLKTDPKGHTGYGSVYVNILKNSGGDFYRLPVPLTNMQWLWQWNTDKKTSKCLSIVSGHLTHNKTSLVGPGRVGPENSVRSDGRLLAVVPVPRCTFYALHQSSKRYKLRLHELHCALTSMILIKKKKKKRHQVLMSLWSNWNCHRNEGWQCKMGQSLWGPHSPATQWPQPWIIALEKLSLVLLTQNIIHQCLPQLYSRLLKPGNKSTSTPEGGQINAMAVYPHNAALFGRTRNVTDRQNS